MPEMGPKREWTMSQRTDEFRIEWDLHELGPRQQPTLVRQLSRGDFARALAAGDVPANAELVDEEEAA